MVLKEPLVFFLAPTRSFKCNFDILLEDLLNFLESYGTVSLTNKAKGFEMSQK